MIGDANTVDEGAVLEADICIVGAGAAGIAMALELAGHRSVLLLESGGDSDEPASQALYEGSVADTQLHSPPVKYRRRALGGSTGIWGGRCVPFDPIDFEARPWIAHSGWPFGMETLLPYYARANAICEAGSFAYTAEAAFPQGMRAMLNGLDSDMVVDNSLERFSCPTNFGTRYRKRLGDAPNLRVLLHANVTELRTSADGGTVVGLVVKTLGGRSFTVAARQVVLATGGLEVVRLLLASRDHQAQGIGNQHDTVGRYYMCHMAGTTGDITLAKASHDAWHGYVVSDEGIYCRRRLTLTAKAQTELRTGNFVGRLHHPRIPDPSHRTGALSALFLAKPFISYEYSKRLHGDGAVSAATWLGHVRNIVLDPFGTSGFLLFWLRKRVLATRKFPTIIIRSRVHTFSLDMNAEQEPNPESRIRLTNERDVLDMPKLLVDWRYTATDMHTVRTAVATVAEAFERNGIGSFLWDPAEVEACSLRDGAYGGHHIGTTRISATPRTGVVDADCRVHGMSNLFIAGSSVFPTSGQANPTLTLVAMALRLAAHLGGAAA